MERIMFLIFLCTSIEGHLGQHFFVSTAKTWDEAQDHCRAEYTDLSFIYNQSTNDELLALFNGEMHHSWIGLQRDPTNLTAWKWSGGGSITYENWAPHQPDNYNDIEDVAEMTPQGTWNDENGAKKRPFFCVRIITTGETKTWEEALDHCRQNQKNLLSLLSETDHQVAKRGIQGERVWLGLRYLNDRWMWVNGDPLVYKAWPQGGDQDHQCPLWKRCGALTKEGLWEDRDCQDKLDFFCS